MDLFRRAVAVTRAPRASLESPAVPLTAGSLVELFGATGKSSAGASVTPVTALNLSTVWRAVNLISTTCAGLPMRTYKDGDGDVRIRVRTGVAARLVDNPHPDLTPLELWELVYGSLCLWGNAYLLKLRNPLGQLVELWWINPCRVKAMRLPDEYGRQTGEKRYVLDGNEGNPLTDKVMLHIPGFGYDGICGVSPIRAAREGLGLAMAAEGYGSRFFDSGALATGILQTDQRLEQDDARRLKELWKQGGSGLDAAHDIRVMGSGAKFQPLSVPNDDAQFLETREFQVTEVARWYGIPPHLLMQTTNSTSWGSGIESQNLGLITYTLSGYLKRVEQRMTRTVKPEPVYVQIDLRGLLRGDSSARADYYTKRFALGSLSPNDIRRLEDEAPVEGGDTYYVPLNFAAVAGPASVADPATDPAPADDPAPNPAVDAAELAQKLYLAVGKVLTVAEARELVAAGAGVSLDEVDAMTVFEDLPPLPSPLPKDDPDPEPDPAAPAEPGDPATADPAPADDGVPADA
jgi:HK97 family phage portal protein